jgi:DNA-binding NarL/FixJ family response regulator
VIERGNSAPEETGDIAVAVRLVEPGLCAEIVSVLADIARVHLVASGAPADVVVTDTVREGDDAAVVIADAASITTALERGWTGLLRHQIDRESLRIAIEAAHEGLVCVPRSIAVGFGDAGHHLEEAEREPIGIQILTAREQEVLQLMANGASNKVIARRLDISVHTAKFHVASVIAKLGATGRTEAVALAMREGIVHV